VNNDFVQSESFLLEKSESYNRVWVVNNNKPAWQGAGRNKLGTRLFFAVALEPDDEEMYVFS
jgi:hypothetical protein